MAQRRNPYSRYNQNKQRDYAMHKYNTGTQEYRDSIDKIKMQVGCIAAVVVLFIVIIICLVAGPGAAIKWLK